MWTQVATQGLSQSYELDAFLFNMYDLFNIYSINTSDVLGPVLSAEYE